MLNRSSPAPRPAFLNLGERLSPIGKTEASFRRDWCGQDPFTRGSPKARVALLVLAKAPVPGWVKTRLCPPAVPAEAADITSAALLDTLDAIRAVARATRFAAAVGAEPALRAWQRTS